ncbi:MAG TPA: hypothetical protein DSN98_09405 [Thermoplasmata archaeon]|nr:MAG TPA: hypothetical protein DSN98_09405 [Thermoplasmata archaeon]
MIPHTLSKKNKKRLITTPMTIALSVILITLCSVQMASACKPVPQIQIIKTGPTFAYAGEEITYTFRVSNPEEQPLSDVTVIDDSCGPAVYVSGNENGNDKLDHKETWIFTASITPTFSFPDPLTNTATAQGSWGDQTATATDHYTLYPFILRKDVLLYWEGENIGYNDPDTLFTIKMTKGEKILDKFSISESAPKELWLSEGTYRFKEINVPAGYLAAYETVTISTCKTYPDYSYINVITFDLSVTKTGPATCYPSDQILYSYTVKNDGPASVTPVLLDDLCGTPVYISGDSDADGLIDPSETWTYQASYTANAEPGSIITNLVTVTDAEGANRAPDHWWLGGDTHLGNNVANWSVSVIPRPEVPADTNDTNDSQNPPDTNQSTNETEEPTDTNETEPPQDTNQTEEPPVQPLRTTSHGPSQSTNIAPVAITNGPYSAQDEERIIFNGSKSYDPDGAIITYSWSFGDGSTELGQTVTHHYTNAGLYGVTLTVTDNRGATDTDTTSATITQPNRAPGSPIIGGPDNGTKNTDYSFVIGASDIDHDDITYLIDWGDGTSFQTDYLPSGSYFIFPHRWETSGTYTITVTASDGHLSTISKKTITIHETLIADNIAIIALALLAIIALLSAMLYSKRKKNNK